MRRLFIAGATPEAAADEALRAVDRSRSPQRPGVGEAINAEGARLLVLAKW